MLARTGFPADSHDAKALMEILETYPRDSLFQIDADELFDVAMGILGLSERQRVRLFVRRDPLDRFISCLVFIPRDRFNTENRERVGSILAEEFGGTRVDWELHLSESLLVRVHYVVHCGDEPPSGYDTAEIEARLVRATRAWTDDLRDALVDEHGEEHGSELYKRYRTAFPLGYRADWVARSAVTDIRRIDELRTAGGPIMSLYRPLEAEEGLVRCKLFSADEVSLSDVMPTFEHMGAKVVDEHPYEISPAGGAPAWIYDFGLRCVADDVERVRDAFQEAFLGVWRGEYENDGLNGLVMGAGLTGREITILRAVGKYLRQAGIAFSDRYMERTLVGHPEIATLLVRLFEARFHPDRTDPEEAEELTAELDAAIDAVQSLDEDRILRSFVAVMRAIVRTNFFRTDTQGEHAGALRAFLSFKLDPALIPILPLPRPRFEIFVYSPRIEGVHLRGGRVARGGLRWSDRREDFRTEILGLMKAQMVKNALIVPVGSKGGFVVKRPPVDGGREALLAEGIACYETFLCGLARSHRQHRAAPTWCRRRRSSATTRMTRTWSSPPTRERPASPTSPTGSRRSTGSGSATRSPPEARRAMTTSRWGSPPAAPGNRSSATSASSAPTPSRPTSRSSGIGDMSGDVFGNGMLLSAHIKLLAAFNHMHVFLDPDPDPAASFAERKRLFELPRSSWSDYDPTLISPGGGVFPRTAKSIPISPQVREALGIEADRARSGRADPRAAARARRPAVERRDRHLCQSLDRDARRRRRQDQRRGPGGRRPSSGAASSAREATSASPSAGGSSMRSRGPSRGRSTPTRSTTSPASTAQTTRSTSRSCSTRIVAAGDMTEKQRNELLVVMTDGGRRAGAGRQLHPDAGDEPGLAQAPPMLDVHARLIRQLEQTAGLNRKIEYLPNDEVVGERKLAHQGLTAPELAVVMAYCKIHLYADLLESDLPEDPYLGHDLERYFPSPLPERYAKRDAQPPTAPRDHRHAGRQPARRPGGDDVRVPPRARRPARRRRCWRARTPSRARCFEMRVFWHEVEALDNHVHAEAPADDADRGAASWSSAPRDGSSAPTRGRSTSPPPPPTSPAARRCSAQALPGVLDGADRGRVRRAGPPSSKGAGVPPALAARVAGMPSMLAVLDIVEVAAASGTPAGSVIATHFGLGSRPGAQLAPGPDPRAAPRQPVAGAGPRRAARRPLQPASLADPGGVGGRRGRRRQRGRDRRLDASQRRRRGALPGHDRRRQGVAHL